MINIQMSQIEQNYLFDCIRLVPENSIIVEIGTLFGGSAEILYRASKEKNNKIFTIDSYELGSTSMENTKMNLQNAGCEGLTVIQGLSSDVAKDWKASIDCLFIDGDHQYESVKLDIESWLSKVKMGGMVLFHDYESWLGVTQAVNEAIEKGELQKEGQAQSLLLTKYSCSDCAFFKKI